MKGKIMTKINDNDTPCTVINNCNSSNYLTNDRELYKKQKTQNAFFRVFRIAKVLALLSGSSLFTVWFIGYNSTDLDTLYLCIYTALVLTVAFLISGATSWYLFEKNLAKHNKSALHKRVDKT
jgi:hypothetical protein